MLERWGARFVVVTMIAAGGLVASAGPSAAAVRLGTPSVIGLQEGVQLHMVPARDGSVVQAECGLHQGLRSRRMFDCWLTDVTTGRGSGTRSISPTGYQPPSVVVSGRSFTLPFACGHGYRVTGGAQVNGYSSGYGLSRVFTAQC